MNIVLPSFLELDWNWTGGMGIDGREWETGIEMGERERETRMEESDGMAVTLEGRLRNLKKECFP